MRKRRRTKTTIMTTTVSHRWVRQRSAVTHGLRRATLLIARERRTRIVLPVLCPTMAKHEPAKRRSRLTTGKPGPCYMTSSKKRAQILKDVRSNIAFSWNWQQQQFFEQQKFVFRLLLRKIDSI